MNLIELKEKSDQLVKLESMIQSLEATIAGEDNLPEGQRKQLRDYLMQCQSEAEKLSGCHEEYAQAWETKRAEVEAAGGDTWNEILRCQEEIRKAKEHIRSMAEVIQWLVIEA